jgi:ribA/ribD-fused uncharacterized protein
MITSFRGEYDWASNMYWKAPFVFNGTTYKTSEHWFVACKTLDPTWIARIIGTFKASDAKKLGKQCPIRSDWEAVRIGAMAQGLWFKFTQNADIYQKLIATDDEPIVEGNYWHDNFWGDCMCENKHGKHPECLQPGKNALGRLHMANRQTFQTMQLLTK